MYAHIFIHKTHKHIDKLLPNQIKTRIMKKYNKSQVFLKIECVFSILHYFQFIEFRKNRIQ